MRTHFDTALELRARAPRNQARQYLDRLQYEKTHAALRLLVERKKKPLLVSFLKRILGRG